MKATTWKSYAGSILPILGACLSVAGLLIFFVKNVGIDKDLLTVLTTATIAFLIGLYSKAIANQVEKLSPYSKVFLSYSHEDKQIAAKLAERLRALSFRVWLDHEQLSPGTDWQERINDGINKADIFLVLLSPSALKSHYLEVELNKARTREDLKIIPVLLENATVPADMKKYNSINISQYDETGIDKVVKQVGALAKH